MPFHADSDRNFSVSDEGDIAGYFHRYEAFRTEGSLDPERTIDVFLPRNYDSNDRRYPVLYLNDGQTAFFKPAMGDQSLDIANTLGALYERRLIRELIVVAIYPVNRAREYTHANWSGPDCCGLESYAQCVAESIKPFIDRSYRTLSESRTTMIAGFFARRFGGLLYGEPKTGCIWLCGRSFAVILGRSG